MSPMSLLTLPMSVLRSGHMQPEQRSTNGAPLERLMANAAFAAATAAALVACFL